MLKLITKHFEGKGFIYFKLTGKKVDNYIYGPAGELLVENIRREWMYNVCYYRDNNVLPIHIGDETMYITKEYVDSFLKAKEFNNSEVPFGIVETRARSGHITSTDPLSPKRTTLLRYFAFLKPGEAEQFYYRWQLQRKRWWRKFSNDPGRFEFAENNDSKTATKGESKILAKFPWGNHELETIQYHGNSIFGNLPKSIEKRLEVLDGKKKCLPHVVESCCSLDYAAWTYLCDAYPLEAQDEILPVIRLHKKLAPFKFTVAAPTIS